MKYIKVALKIRFKFYNQLSLAVTAISHNPGVKLQDLNTFKRRRQEIVYN